jgi:hypothetical protein
LKTRELQKRFTQNQVPYLVKGVGDKSKSFSIVTDPFIVAIVTDPFIVLHDDVTARLLTLIHRGKDIEAQNTARETLSSLRQVIYALDDNKPITLSHLSIELQANIRTSL